MGRHILSIIILGLFAFSCGRFEQNDFISTENVGQIGNEQFIYSAFQTGPDNYRIEFKVIVDSDTSRIFDYAINDALYTQERSFHFKISDTLSVLTPFQPCKIYYKTKKGTTVELTKTLDTKACEHSSTTQRYAPVFLAHHPLFLHERRIETYFYLNNTAFSEYDRME
jgi:hypothetical protein